MTTLRQRLITHILQIKQVDPEYARYALKQYHEILPWMDIIKGVKERINDTTTRN